MINQLRIYEIPAENRGPFHDRFRDQATPIFERHGFRIQAMWDLMETITLIVLQTK